MILLSFVSLLLLVVPHVHSQSLLVGGYDLTPLLSVAASQTDQTYMQGSITYRYRMFGNLSDPQCQGMTVCSKTSTKIVNFGTWTGANPFWAFPVATTDGIHVAIQNGDTPTGFASPSIILYRFYCDLTTDYAPSTSPAPLVMNSALGVTININTRFVCGPGSRAVTASPQTPRTSSLTRCVRWPGKVYQAELCPRGPLSPGFAMPSLMSMTSTFSQNDKSPMPLEFWSYGVNRTSAISYYGNMFWNYSASSLTTSPTSAMPTPSSSVYYGLDPSSAPALFALASGVTTIAGPTPTSQPTTSTAQFKGWLAGDPSSRQLLMRYENSRDIVPKITNAIDAVNTYDVVLHEGVSTDIEVRYYKIEPTLASTSGVLRKYTIGMQGEDVDSYTRVLTASPIAKTFAEQLQGATLRFTTSIETNASSACSQFDMDFGSIITNDMEWIDSTNGTKWYINPCHQLSDSNLSQFCMTMAPNSSVCMQSSDGSLNIATAISYPTHDLIEWSLSPDVFGTRQTFRSGGYCMESFAPAVLDIDWVCERNAVAPSLNVRSIYQTSNCSYHIAIFSRAACSSSILCGPMDPHVSNMTICPTVQSPVSLSNPASVLPFSNGAASVQLPFPIAAGGILHQSIWIGNNGAVTFGQVPYTSSSFDDIYQSVDPSISLVIAPFITNLTFDHTSSVVWSEEECGEAFVVQYFAGYTVGSMVEQVQFDLILRLDTSSQNVSAVFVYYNVPHIAAVQYGAGLVGQLDHNVFAHQTILTPRTSSILSGGAVVHLEWDNTVYPVSSSSTGESSSSSTADSSASGGNSSSNVESSSSVELSSAGDSSLSNSESSSSTGNSLSSTADSSSSSGDSSFSAVNSSSSGASSSSTAESSSSIESSSSVEVSSPGDSSSSSSESSSTGDSSSSTADSSSSSGDSSSAVDSSSSGASSSSTAESSSSSNEYLSSAPESSSSSEFASTASSSSSTGESSSYSTYGSSSSAESSSPTSTSSSEPTSSSTADSLSGIELSSSTTSSSSDSNASSSSSGTDISSSVAESSSSSADFSSASQSPSSSELSAESSSSTPDSSSATAESSSSTTDSSSSSDSSSSLLSSEMSSSSELPSSSGSASAASSSSSSATSSINLPSSSHVLQSSSSSELTPLDSSSTAEQVVDTEDQSNAASSLNGGEIAGIIIGVIAAVVLMVIVALCVVSGKSKPGSLDNASSSQVVAAQDIELGSHKSASSKQPDGLSWIMPNTDWGM